MATLQKQNKPKKCIIENRNFFQPRPHPSTAANALFLKKDGCWQGVAFGRLLKIKETERTLEF